MTNAELAILSLVAEKPRHGYEIERVIQARGMREWTEVGFSSIYYLLRKLERKGLVIADIVDDRPGPRRRTYRITPAGEKALETGVLEALSTPQQCYPPLQLGLANLPAIACDKAQAALRRYGQALEARSEYLQARREEQRPLPYFVEAMFDHSLTMIEAELGWVAGFLLQLEGRGDSRKEANLGDFLAPEHLGRAKTDFPGAQEGKPDGQT
jgi:DNA-binding PadR family transcriptional regulator